MAEGSALLARVRARAEAAFEESVRRLVDFLRIPSVGTDPARAADTRRAAEWLARELAGLGLAVELAETGGHPVVLARGGPDRGPRVLYYGHYDVQPPDPVEAWSGDPFNPRIVDGPHGPRVVARGASDDKGQLMTIVEALRAWVAETGGLPVPVTLMVEGEEESGSAHLPAFVRARREALAADVAVISDTAMMDPDTPAITASLRGIVYVELRLRGPARDLHSGLYGGVAPNPLHALAAFLAGLHDARGRVTLPGFYDRVRPPEPALREAWARLPFDEAAFFREGGFEVPVGEEGHDTLARLWARPCLDVNGIAGGYVGEGAKTVIPAEARAKFSCRLVPDQRADEVFAAIERACRERLPAWARFELLDLGRGDPLAVDPESPAFAVAREALAAVFGRAPVAIGCGGSIPVAGVLAAELGLVPLLVGFGLEDDRVHAPDEKFELVNFRRGILTHVHMLAGFAARGGSGSGEMPATGRRQPASATRAARARRSSTKPSTT